MREYDVAIVGAGPAGLAASRAASNAGCSVVVLDDQHAPGGQYFRHPAPAMNRVGRNRFDSEPALAGKLFDALDSPAVDYRGRTTVWDIPETGVLAVAAGPESGRVHARTTILATGAHDRSVPFPGWTLPGVVSAGGALNLIKGQRVRPGHSVVVAGNGPLALVVAANLRRAGAKVAAVAEAAPVSRRAAAALFALSAAPDLLLRGLGYRATLLSGRTPVLESHTVTRANGDHELASVDVAPIDANGEIDDKRASTIDCDTLVVAFGLRVSSELTRLAGCDHAYVPGSGGWLPARCASFETSTPGLFAVGDGARIGGAALALCEGALAGLAAAERSRGTLPAQSCHERHRLQRRLSRLEGFRAALDRVYQGPASYAVLADDDTVICRCEDLTLGELRRAQAAGMSSLTQLKGATRASMGRCQGRYCLAALAELTNPDAEGEFGRPTWPRVRPPARPIPIGDLMHERIAPPALPHDPHLPRRTKV